MATMDYSQLASWYDHYVRADCDVPFFLEEARDCGRVLELMSGTGRVSLPLIEAGAALTCVDSSPAMLAVLREKLARRRLSAAVLETDVCELSLDQTFDLAIIPFHAFEEIVRLDEQRAALARIRACLSEAGRLVCPLHNSAARLPRVNGELRLRAEYPLPDAEGTVRLWSREERATDALVTGLQIVEILDPLGLERERHEVELAFYLHARRDFEHLARSCSYRVLALYGDYDRSAFRATRSAFMIWVLGCA